MRTWWRWSGADSTTVNASIVRFPGFWCSGAIRSRATLGKEADWGRGSEASSGKPIGAAEISRKRLHVAGAVAMAHPGSPAAADSQMYVTLARRADLDGYYTVFGARDRRRRRCPLSMQRGDVITRMYVQRVRGMAAC